MKTSFYHYAGRLPAWLLLAASGLLASPALAQTPATFAPVAPYSTGAGSFPVTIAVADVNGDGKPDLLTADPSNGNVGVQLGTGTGSFGAVSQFTGAGNSASIAVADVNGDGRPDLLTANANVHTVGVLLGTGNGSFGAVTEFSVGASQQPIGITVADVNGDGKLDLLTANGGGDTAGVLLGTGNGSFGAAATYSTGGAGSHPYEVAVADVNKDGKPDLLTANSNGSAGVLLGNGNGTFGTITTYSTGAGSAPTDIKVADVNGDGKLDLLTANIFGNAVGVLLGNGNGTFGTITTYSTGAGSSPFKLALADVNGDGKLDVLTDNRSTDAAGVLLGTGNGTFGSVTPFSIGVGGHPEDIAVADVNGDGKPDLLTANGALGTAAVLLNTTPMPGNRGFLPIVTYGTGAGTSPNSVAVADVNGDGKLDLLTANGGNGTAGVQLGTGTGTFGTATTYGTGISHAENIAVADVNGDGKLDLVTDYGIGGQVSVLLGTGTGAFGPATVYSIGGRQSPGKIVVADTNGDGKPDILTANYGGGFASGGGSVGVLMNTGNGTFVYGGSGTGATNQTTSIAVADVNGDGKLDLLATVSSSSSPASGVQVLLAGSSGPSMYYVGPSYSAPVDIEVADVNADGKPDLLISINSSGNEVAVLLNTGNGGFKNATYYNAASGNIAVADVNGDGKLDLLVTAGSGIDQLLGNGDGTFGTATTYSTGAGNAPFDIAVADVNSDGKPDLLTANSGNITGVLLGTTVVAPTLISISPTSGPVGTSVTLTGTDLTGATGVSFNGTAATTLAVVNSTTITATVPAGASTGAVTVATPGGTATGPTFTVITDLVVTTTATIQPGTYNSITVNAPGVGTLGGNVTVNASLTVNTGATLNDGCAVISGAGTFTLAAGGTLGICNVAGIAASGATGAVQVTGTRSFSADASYVYTGTAAQSTGTGLPSQVRNLSTTNANTVTLASPTSVAQVLTVGAAGNLALNGQALTLLSSASGTALLVNSGTGVVSGTATVQRSIDPSKNAGNGYRHYAAPVGNTTVADLTTSSFTPTVNDAYNTSATPSAVTPFPTVFGYDQALVNRANSSPAFDKGFFSPASLATPLVPGRGYTVQIGASQLVDFVGSLTQTTVPVAATRNATGTLNSGDAGWQFLGNPYASPLDFTKFSPDSDYPGLDGSFYVQESSGPYSGSYRAYVNGMGTSPLIASSQGFFMRKTAPGSTTVTFRNSQRVTTFATQVPFYRLAADLRPQVQLALRSASGQADAFYAYAEAGATAGFDSKYDAWKLVNSTGLNLAGLNASGESLSIDGRAAFTLATAIALTVGVPAAGTYALAAADIANLPAGLDAYLRDAQTGQTTKLSAGTSYAFSVSAAEVQAAIGGRFTLQFSAAGPLATAPSLTATAVSVYPNPAHGRFVVGLPGLASATQMQAELLNALGQVVRRQSAALPTGGTQLTIDAAGLAAGVYTLRLQAGGTTLAKKLVIN